MYKRLEARIEIVREKSAKLGPQIKTPTDVFKLLADLKYKDREYFVVLCLNTRNRVICINTVSIGSLNASLVHCREVFKPAILANSQSIILAHNHPSGDTEPSKDDIEITKRVAEAGKVLGIPLLDHVIIGNSSYESFKGKTGFSLQLP